MIGPTKMLLLVAGCSCAALTSALHVPALPLHHAASSFASEGACTVPLSPSFMPRRPRLGRTALHMAEPRRNRSKRPTKSESAKRRRGLTSSDADEGFAWEEAETRPLIRDISTERGEDYWVDPVEMEKVRTRCVVQAFEKAE